MSIDPDGWMTPEEIADVFCHLLLRGLLTDSALSAYESP
jgi:hypothetical protein